MEIVRIIGDKVIEKIIDKVSKPAQLETTNFVYVNAVEDLGKYIDGRLFTNIMEPTRHKSA